VLEVLYHHAKFGGARISPADGAPKTLSFLFVCLFVTLFNVRGCAPDFAMKALEYRNDFDTVGQGKVCTWHPCSTFSDCCQLATPALNAEGQKTAKIAAFRRHRTTE